jgi:hypothetical protein
MPRKLSPSMRHALRTMRSGRYLLFRPADVPGGYSTIRALVRRGLVEPDNSGHYRITGAGRAEVER